MKTYRVTIRLNVEDAGSAREIERGVRNWLAAELPYWKLAGIPASVASVSAYEDVLIQERAA